MSETENARAELRIYGRVQGVFFRANTRDQARRRGVTGWVENLSDGTVKAVLEGPRADVESVVEWAHEGPPKARVDDLEVDWNDYTGEFDEFRIRR
ncbi:MAG: acylphosphatase [Bradymonadaceae bacterium]